MASTRLALVFIGLLAAAAVCKASMPLELEMEDTPVDLSLEQQADPCPQVENMVRSLVVAARNNNPQLTAGLLRIFFHDCFPQGCDASILLAGERDNGPNSGSLQEEALKLIEAIRFQVHNACKATVSCADILALATRDSVVAAGGPSYPVIRGRMDSRTPADDLSSLPSPFSDIGSLLQLFSDHGFTKPEELVALSGGHTVGKAHCSLARPDFPQTCTNDKQNLDVITPDAFDNKYYVALRNNRGVFLSDQGLANHPRTKDIVKAFAEDQKKFFDWFAKSMAKLSQMKGPAAKDGQIRNDCSKPNSRMSIIDDVLGASGEEGLAASA